MKIHIISLGCAKNLVDSETLSGMLLKNQHELVPTIETSDFVILSTCSFIGTARREAKQYINKLLKLKKKLRFKLIVTGCLPQIEKEILIKTYPQIDAIFGVSDYPKILNFITNLDRQKIFVSEQPNLIQTSRNLRVISTLSYAYLKIADGCDNRCSYCLIPMIRGSYRERPMEDIVEEAKKIVSSGRKEIILISQDTSLYGIKIYKKQMLHKLIRKLSNIKGLVWIRMLYSHPAHFYDELIKEIANNEKVCKYVDIPIQHTSDKILSLMNRRITRKQIFSLIEKLRKVINNLVLRTTVMVGFPYETQKEFKILYNDIKAIEFDWLGAFIFSPQKNTIAAKFENKIPFEVKKQRYSEIMQLQQKIIYKKNKNRIGKTYDVLIDGKNFGHTEFQCPEVDGRTYFESYPSLAFGEIKKMEVVAVRNIYDLLAKEK